MSYTPGPWRYEGDVFDHEEGPVWVIEDVHKRNNIIAKLFASGVEQEALHVPKEEQEANARLIAAAPELLAALEEALHDSELETRHHGRTTLDEGKIRALIAKAKGEQQ